MAKETAGGQIFKVRNYSRYFLLSFGIPPGIHEVSLSTQGLELKGFYKVYGYKWDEIQKAAMSKITLTGKGGSVVIPLLVIQTTEKTFSFDPRGFLNGDDLLENVLSKYIKIPHVKEKSDTVPLVVLYLSLFSLLFLYLWIPKWYLVVPIFLLFIILFHVYRFKEAERI